MSKLVLHCGEEFRLTLNPSMLNDVWKGLLSRTVAHNSSNRDTRISAWACSILVLQEQKATDNIAALVSDSCVSAEPWAEVVRSDWWAMSKLVLHCGEEFWLTLNPPQVLSPQINVLRWLIYFSSSFVLLCRGTGRPPSSYHGNFTLHKRNQNLCWIYSPYKDGSWWGINMTSDRTSYGKHSINT